MSYAVDGLMLQLSVDQYQVGWVCALPCEYATAKAMLDEQHQMVSGQDRADTNSYTLGRIHSHNVVIACLPAGVDGTNAAAVVATNLCRTFRSIRFGLLVGIGGGIPNLQEDFDIRLGDVVVGQPSGTNGGVVQYDKGKSNIGERFERKGQLNKPPTALLTALSNLQAEHQIDESLVSSYLEKMLVDRPKMRKLGYSFPVGIVDTLLCTHVTQTSTSCAHCEEGKIKRQPRESIVPVIHYGVIASGNQVIKNAIHRDQLRDECGGAICVEMEAAGLVDSFPCLVIRGICDYADSLKNDKWHNYAAATAAAFAKELLLYVSVEQTGYEQSVQEIFDFITTAQDHFRDQKEHGKWQQMHAQQQEIQRIPIIATAMYGSQGEVHEFCHPATRVNLLHQIQHWALQPFGKAILWLSGQAGTGKSTIAWTFAGWLASQGHSQHVELGASFFFKRGDGDRASARRLFPTIIRQLIAKVSGLDALVAEVIKSNPFVFDTALAEQFRLLILQPLRDLSVPETPWPTLVVVIDALDECEKQTDIETILKLWSQLSRLTAIRLRLFLTSRPELTIRFEFRHMPTGIFHDIDLVDAVPQSTIRDDLQIYIDDSLRSIQERYNSHLMSAPMIDSNWPCKSDVQQLVDMSLPLFIIAATICRFVGDPELNPKDSLREILDNRNIGEMSQMELTYLPVLSHLTTPVREDKQRETLWHEFRVIVGSIILLAEGLSINSLSSLLAIDCELISRRLAPLHSVFCVPSDQCTLVRPLHLSFAEFLQSPKAQTQPFGVNGPDTHLALSGHCLRLLSGPDGLRENICNLRYPGQLRHEVVTAIIADQLSPAVQYACRYWIYHTKHSGCLLEDESDVLSFLKQHFLHWLEALSLMNCISLVIGLLDDLRSHVQATASSLLVFLEDARRFVLAHSYILDLAPLQLYSSAIMFSPQNSVVRTMCGRIPSWIQQYPRATLEWGPELQKFEGHSSPVYAVSFSPDGSLLASGTGSNHFTRDECTIWIWKVQTGRAVQKLRGHPGPIRIVMFSPDGSLLASVSTGEYDYTMQLWEVQTGRAIHTFMAYSGSIDSISFSPDSFLLALLCSTTNMIVIREVQAGREVQRLKGHFSSRSAISFISDDSLVSVSYDRTIRIWNIQTGHEVQTRTLEAYSNWDLEASLSPDRSLLALSCIMDQTTQICEMQTGRVVRNFKQTYGFVGVRSFSHDNSLFASADFNTVCVREVYTDRAVQKLRGHAEPIKAISFSPDSSLLASGSDDHTIRIWEVHTGREVQTRQEIGKGREVQILEDFFGSVDAISFSPDGSLLALKRSGGWTLIWDTQTGREVRTLEGYADWVGAVSFSPNGSLLASRSDDHTIRVWDTRTRCEMQVFKVASAIRRVQFADNQTLITDQGQFTVSASTALADDAQSSQESIITVSNDWIIYKGQKLLWLPHEYRGEVTASCGDMLAISASSGRFSFFRFQFCTLDII